LTLYWKNGKVATTDGPYAETKEQLGGILALEARDMNHAGAASGPDVRQRLGDSASRDLNEIMKASEHRRRQKTAF
jgi:hypothetical protein